MDMHNIVDTLTELDLEQFDLLRKTMSVSAVDQATLIRAGNNPSFEYDTDQPLIKGQSIHQRLPAAMQVLQDAKDSLNAFHPLERSLLLDKIDEVRTKYLLVSAAGTPSAGGFARQLFAINAGRVPVVQAQLLERIAELEGPASPIPETDRVDKGQFRRFLGYLGDLHGLDLKIEEVDAPNASFNPLSGALNIPEHEQFYKDASAFKLVAITGPHEFGHLLSAENGAAHPSPVVSLVLSTGSKQYLLGEEGREKYRQIARVEQLAERGVITEDQAKDYLRNKEFAASKGHFLAYGMRLEGADDQQVYAALREFQDEPVAARTTVRSRLGVPSGEAFAGYLVYFYALQDYAQVAKHPAQALMMENGKMNTTMVQGTDQTPSLYRLLVDEGLARSTPAHPYDEEGIVDVVETELGRYS